MKKLVLIGVGICFMILLNAQKWNMRILNITDNATEKTIKIKPGMNLTVRSLFLDNDSLKGSKLYQGSFLGGSDDSLKIKLNKYLESISYSNGITKVTTIPGKSYLFSNSTGKGSISIPLSDIHFISYSARNSWSNVTEIAVFTSLFLVILSPLISYNFSKAEFNAERYKYWGVSSSIAFTASLCFEGILAKNKKEYQFKTRWPGKNNQVWGFKKGL
jgi:hypothetical protein